MFERMLDKSIMPNESQILETLGQKSYEQLMQFEEILSSRYDLHKELRFPFGNSYGWGYKYSHKTFHLCYAFFEKGAFTVMLQIGDKQVEKAKRIIAGLSDKTKIAWDERYPCGDQGGWIFYRVIDDHDVLEIIQCIYAKKAPLNQ